MINLVFIVAYSEYICNNISSHIKAICFLGLYRSDRWSNPKFSPALDGRDTRVDFERYDF